LRPITTSWSLPNFINDLNAGKVKVQKENTGRTPKLC
jgi:hypothetical protein